MSQVDQRALAVFTEYFVKNYPGPNTIISDPNWHAPKIFRAAQAALSVEPAEPVAWVLYFNDPDPQCDIEFGAECPKAWKGQRAEPLYDAPQRLSVEPANPIQGNEAKRDGDTAALLRELAKIRNEWQQGAWADAPRRENRVEERIANAQFVTDWLTKKIEDGEAEAPEPNVQKKEGSVEPVAPDELATLRLAHQEDRELIDRLSHAIDRLKASAPAQQGLSVEPVAPIAHMLIDDTVRFILCEGARERLGEGEHALYAAPQPPIQPALKESK